DTRWQGRHRPARDERGVPPRHRLRPRAAARRGPLRPPRSEKSSLGGGRRLAGAGMTPPRGGDQADPLSRAAAVALDDEDPLRSYRDRFMDEDRSRIYL